MNNNQDSFDNWLRQTAGQYRPEAPADAWQRLAPHLPQRRRRRWIVFWLLCGTAALGGILFLYFDKHSWIPEAPPDPTQSVALATPLYLSNKEAAPGPACVPMSSDKGILISTSVSTPQTTTAPASVPGRETQANAVTTAVLEMRFPSLSPVDAATLPAQAISLASERGPVAIRLPEVAVKKSSFHWGINAAPALFMQRGAPALPHSLAFAETPAQPGHGWQAGVSLTYKASKRWHISTGIQHVRQTHAAQHIASLRLIDGICLNPDDPGIKEYAFQYTLVSGRQTSDLTLLLEQEHTASTMPPDEYFSLDMKTLRRTTAWRIPLTLERHFGAGRWHGFVRGGALIDIGEKTSIEVLHFTEMCQDLCFASGHVPHIQAATRASVSVGWMAGAGLERSLSPRMAWRIEPFVAGQKGYVQTGLNTGLIFFY